jgi:hypothetical protein
VILGELARLVSVPPAVDFSAACHDWTPTALVGAFAPGPLNTREPYVIFTVWDAATVKPETVTDCPDTDTEPALEVV